MFYWYNSIPLPCEPICSAFISIKLRTFEFTKKSSVVKKVLACVDYTFTSLCVFFLVLLLTDCIFHRKNYSTNTLARLEKREMRNKEKKVSNLTPTYAFNLMRLFSIDKIHKFSSLFHLRERAASHIF